MKRASWDSEPEAQQAHGLFQDALAGWANDDVLQTEAARAALGASRPALLRVLDWPNCGLCSPGTIRRPRGTAGATAVSACCR